MGTIVITSRLGEDFREDLEQVLFFNPKQHKAMADIKHCMELYGIPEITNERGYLRISLDSYSVAQTLYSIDRSEAGDTLAGVIVFVRNTIEDISILHIAIAKNYILQGPIVTARLVWNLLHQVTESASHIGGVRNVKLAYVGSTGKSSATITSIPISKQTQKQSVKKNKSGLCPDEAVTCIEYQYCYDCTEKDVSKKRNPLIH